MNNCPSSRSGSRSMRSGNCQMNDTTRSSQGTCRSEISRSSDSRRENRADSCPFNRELKTMTQEQLLRYIDQISFVVSDMLLYLDTHPDDQCALNFCREHISMRRQALNEYARLYGPLTIDTADDAASDSWLWVTTPWPWEGRMC